MSKKVLLVDVDSKMPNLALMKFSAHHKELGDEVTLWKLREGEQPPISGFDKVYISCIFAENAERAERIARAFQSFKGTNSHAVEIGGYGVNEARLPRNVEHIMPDYDLYGCDFSMGFTSRGCIRNCEFCIIPEKEGPIRDHASISEFLHPDHGKLIPLDNNFLASPKWKENLQFIIDHGLKVSFCQGLDIRLVNEENAGMLAACRYYSIRFTERRLYFAFDHPSMEREVRRGVGILKQEGISPGRLMFYFLCGFGDKDSYDFGEDYHRFKVLLELGVDPYVMKYNGRRDIRILNHFSRWVIRRDYKRKRPKYLRPHELQELQEAISNLEESV